MKVKKPYRFEQTMEERAKHEEAQKRRERERLSNQEQEDVSVMERTQQLITSVENKHALEIENTKSQLNNGVLYVEREDTPLFVVVRLRGIVGVPPAQKKTMDMLKLHRRGHVAFVKNTQNNRGMLHVIKDWVAYGAPTYKTVRNLIYLKGNGLVNGRKYAISKRMLQTTLGEGFICKEDLCYHIYNATENFQNIVRLLAPCRLPPPVGGYRKKALLAVTMGGALGNHGYDINPLVDRMLGLVSKVEMSNARSRILSGEVLV